MNKNQAQAMQMSIDGLIDTLYELRKSFDNVEYNRIEKVKFSTLVNFGPYLLQILMTQLEGDIDAMKDCITNEYDENEIKCNTELLNAQFDAYYILKKAIKQSIDKTLTETT
jgi:hypothetical protein